MQVARHRWRVAAYRRRRPEGAPKALGMQAQRAKPHNRKQDHGHNRNRRR